MSKGDDNEDLGRIHVQVKLKKKRNVTAPDTTIRITIMEAKKLPPRARADTCDPYVMLEFEKTVKKTQVRFKQSVSSVPEWSETFVFEAWSDRLDSSLLISVMDHQEWRKDKVQCVIRNPVCDISNPSEVFGALSGIFETIFVIFSTILCVSKSSLC